MSSSDPSKSHILAQRIIDELARQGYKPVQIAELEDEGERGVWVVVVDEDFLHVDFECYDNGELVLCMSNRIDSPDVWGFGESDIPAAVSRAIEFIERKGGGTA